MLYLYAITDAPAGELALPATGILPDSPVIDLSLPGLTAIASEVPAEIFGEAPLRALLEDAAWMRQRVLAHEQVVAALKGTVLPLKFGTLFSVRDTLIATMSNHREALEETLARLRGAREWGVKLFCDLDRLRRWIDAAQPPQADGAACGAGAAFFARKQRDRWLQGQTQAAIRACVEHSHDRLARLVRAAAVVSPQSPALHGRPEEMSLNAAYLVAETQQDKVLDCLRELTESYAPQGFDFVLTGPWAPYNFARIYLGELPQPPCPR